ncbi:MAG: beta-mannosidase [Rhizobiales bacterium PAR1]|nr:MAG: beta-mannosidase [Rhizobiales bacterium PAR1]
MALIRTSTGEDRRELSGWECLSTTAGAHTDPSGLAGTPGWIPAVVPGTLATSLKVVGPVAGAFDQQDHWYRTRLDAPLEGQLVFEGLATLCDIFINGEKRAQSVSMFEPVALDVDLASGTEIALCFRALAPKLAAAPRRSRWRPAMVQPNGLRCFRTTALGSMPGWCPEGRPIGPYRPILGVTRKGDALSSLNCLACDVRTRVEGETGIVSLRFTLKSGETHSGVAHCGEASGALRTVAPDVLEGEVIVPDVRLWFPHTHGEPALYPLALDIAGTRFDLGKIGFRTLQVDRGADGKGFGLILNGVPVFCRGASWTNAEVSALPCGRAAYARWLTLAKEAGMNMLRVSGVMTYESEAFFDLCDELGIMVWQDMMLANFDYPQADEGFLAAIRAEVETLLDRAQTSPSLVVLCGGSEVFQQAAMLGAPREVWSGPVFETVLPETVAKLRPDIAYVPNSPSGGALPFIANEGVTHYYGVGAYMRDLDDARRAGVRFAAECLAFANVPEEASLGHGAPPAILHHPDWKRGVPRDAGASWDFDDVRDHYLERLYGVSALHLRRDDPERYFARARAVVAEVMEASFAEWRRPASPTRGALVWFLQDLAPGAGWGVIASDGEPKSGWYALKRAFRPVQLAMTDEGVNGLALHVLNERAEPLAATLSFTAWRDGATPVVSAARDLMLAPRTDLTIPAFEMLDAFFDLTYAYRFGPPGHSATSARLSNSVTGETLAEAFHFPQGRGNARETLGLSATLVGENGECFLDIATTRFAQSVHLVDENWRASDNWFHLAPGGVKRVKLVARACREKHAPAGEVRAVNGLDAARYGG